ncbi:MAG: hypothetical protein ACJA16_004438 [Akkermansiaceae bacterium]|jgi:hypothetical protein
MELSSSVASWRLVEISSLMTLISGCLGPMPEAMSLRLFSWASWWASRCLATGLSGRSRFEAMAN